MAILDILRSYINSQIHHLAGTAIEKGLLVNPQSGNLGTVKAQIHTNTKQHVPQIENSEEKDLQIIIGNTEEKNLKPPSVDGRKDDSGTKAISVEDYRVRVPKPRSGWPKVGNVERGKLIESMSAFLLQGDRSQRKLAVLSGPSGYGKTQVAVFFADKYEKEFDSFLYINAATQQTIEQSMASRLGEIWNTWKDRPKTKPEDSKTITATVIQWLSLDTNNKWLLILDNVNKYVERSYDRSANKLTPYDIRDYIPRTKNGGTVIITTQYREDYDNGPSSIKFVPNQLEAKTFDVLGMTPEEGNALLDSLGVPTTIRNRLDVKTKLVESLHYCPFEIVQFCNNLGDDLLEDKVRRIVEDITEGVKIPEPFEIVQFPNNLGDDEQACHETLNKLMRGSIRQRAAVKLLMVCCYLNPQDIWYKLLERGLVHPDTPSWFREMMSTEKEFKATIGILTDHHLLSADEEIESFTIHDRMQTFIQTFIKNFRHIDKEEYLHLALSSVAFSNCSLYHMRTRAIRRRLFPHVVALLEPLSRGEGFGATGFRIDKLSKPQQEAISHLLEDPDEKGDSPKTFQPCGEILGLYLSSNGPEEVVDIVESLYDYVKNSDSEVDKFEVGFLLGVASYRLKRYNRSLEIGTILQAMVSNAEVPDNAFVMSAGILCHLSRYRMDKSKIREAQLGIEEIVSRTRKFFPHSVRLIWNLQDLAVLYLDGESTRASEIYKEILEETVRIIGTVDGQVVTSTPYIHERILDAAANTTVETEEDLNSMETDRVELHKRAWRGLCNYWGEAHEYSLREAEELAWIYDEEGHYNESIEVRLKLSSLLQDFAQTEKDRISHNLRRLADAYIKRADGLINEWTDKNESQAESTAYEGNLLKALEVLQNKKFLRGDVAALAIQFGVAIRYANISNYEKAIQLIEDTVSALKEMPNSTNEYSNLSAALSTLAIYLAQADHTEDADKVLEELRALPVDGNNLELSISILVQKADACNICGHPDWAIPYYKQVRELKVCKQELKPDDIEVLDLDYEIGCAARKADQSALAKEVLQAIVKTVDERRQQLGVEKQNPDKDQNDTRYTSLRYNSIRLLGIILLEQPEPDFAQAKQSFEEALAGFEQLGNFEDIAYTLVDLLEVGVGQGLREPGKDFEYYFNKLVQLRVEHPLEVPKWILGKASLYQGVIANRAGRYHDGEISLKHALLELLQERTPVEALIVNAECFLRVSYWKQGKLTDAIDLIQRRNKSVLKQMFDENKADSAMLQHALEQVIIHALLDEYQASMQLAIVLLEICESINLANNSRTLSIFQVLRGVEDMQLFGPNSPYKVSLSDDGWLVFYNGDKEDILWTTLQPKHIKAHGTHLLPEEMWQIKLLCGKPDEVLDELPDHIRDNLEFNSPPEGKIWPRSWTFVPGPSQTVDGKWSIPLRIAGAPVIIPVPWRYPLMSTVSVTPPGDPHETISPAAPVTRTLVEDVFGVFDFARGFYLLLNGLLQLVVDDELDVEWALTHKPNRFGGLKVEYVHMELTPTAGRDRIGQEPGQEPVRLQVHSIVLARRKGKNKSAKENARLGLKVRASGQGNQNAGREFLTTSSHSLWKVAHRWSFSKLFPMKDTPPHWIERVEVTDESCELVGTGAESFDSPSLENPFLYPEAMQADISLICPSATRDTTHLISPISNLKWMSKDTWHELRSADSAEFLVLGSKDAVVGIRNRADENQMDANRQDAMVVGQAIWRGRTAKEQKKSKIDELAGHISQCLLFRVWPGWTAPLGRSGTVIYSSNARRTDDSIGPAVAGFMAYYQPAASRNIRALAPNRNMDNRNFQGSMREGQVAFYLSYELPEELIHNYDIVCPEVVQETNIMVATDGQDLQETPTALAGPTTEPELDKQAAGSVPTITTGATNTSAGEGTSGQTRITGSISSNAQATSTGDTTSIEAELPASNLRELKSQNITQEAVPKL